MGARKEYCFPQKIAKLVTSLTYKPSNLPLKEQVDNEITLFLYNELLRYTFCFEVYLRFFVLDEYLKPDSQNSFITNLFFKNPASFVLSFNYTSTLETLYGIGPNKVHHIHGAVRDKDEFLENMDRENYQLQTQLVLGYHDEDKFQTSIDIPFLWFEKFFQRMLHKTGNKFFSWIHQQHDPIQTIIYGHSLDKTDEDFIRLIFEKSACVLVYYHRESGLPKLIANLIGIFDRSLVNEYYTSGKLVFIPIPDKAE